MDLGKKQSEKYLEEAELTLLSAQAVFERAKEEDKELWANVVKSSYDAIEQAVSAAIADKGEVIPKEHPKKIEKFINLFYPNEELKRKICFWLGKRSRAQYIDIFDDELSVPHELFHEEDAQKSLEDSKEIINEIKKLIKR